MSRVVYNALMPDYVVEEELVDRYLDGFAVGQTWVVLKGFDSEREAIDYAKVQKGESPESNFRVVSNRV